MFVGRASVRKRMGEVSVYLNVYDVTTINGYAYWLGLGVYHSGVQVHGVEYAYGSHDHPTTGIYESEPRSCPRFSFRKSILIGNTDLEKREVRILMEELAEGYTGNTYNLISKNCNHFCNDACLRLTGNAIPRWVQSPRQPRGEGGGDGGGGGGGGGAVRVSAGGARGRWRQTFGGMEGWRFANGRWL
ncbi:hypothetical protein HPP92_016908 [Vanilla planifolia]|uniref:PPPDE domain-containing protein n=1 Tax=Vanilla planifolia TaxID=51239 RepID=A0A835QR80_VANPL|nr:hypothetical protein HPP92_016908 [Vanilla planifolia]